MLKALHSKEHHLTPQKFKYLETGSHDYLFIVFCFVITVDYVLHFFNFELCLVCIKWKSFSFTWNGVWLSRDITHGLAS